MSKSRHAFTSLLHRVGVVGAARVRVFQGSGTPKIVRGTGVPSVLLLALVLLAFSFAPAAALAHSDYTSIGTFGAAGSGAGQLELRAFSNEPQFTGTAGSGVAVNDETHDVYVADTGNHRIDEFTAEGKFVLMFGKEVNKTAVVLDGTEAEQDLCTAESHDECQVGTSGSAPGELESPTFVAVDNDPSSESFEDVYVGDFGDSLVTKFTASGEVVKAWGDHVNAKEEPEPDGQLEGRNLGIGSGSFAAAGEADRVGDPDESGGIMGSRRTARETFGFAAFLLHISSHRTAPSSNTGKQEET